MFKVSVASHLEEGQCPCGWPMYVGDYGYWSDLTNTLYCCKAHATEGETESANAEADYYAAPVTEFTPARSM